MSLYYDIRNKHKEGTQGRIIADIFWERQGEEITSRQLQTQYGLRWLAMQTGVANPTISEILAADAILPGDLQRQVRTFWKTHENHGLTEKDPENKRNMTYIFNPKLISEITPEVKDCRCYSKEVSDNLMEKHKGCCEFCSEKSLRMAIDHWRPYDNTGVTDARGAVLLCERCNNIKSSRSAIHLVTPNKHYPQWFSRSAAIEKRVTDAGFPPSNKEQKEITRVMNLLEQWKAELGF